MPKVKLLIVDDSAFMRKAIENMVKKDPEIVIVGTAKNGIEAVEQVKTLRPDVITLDIEMPRMDGLTALQKIMAENPLPVIMVSSLTTEGAEATLKALDLGAVDFIPKDKSFASFGVMKIEDQLIAKVKGFGAKKMFFRRPSLARPSMPSSTITKPTTPPRPAPKITSKKKAGYHRYINRRSAVTSESNTSASGRPRCPDTCCAAYASEFYKITSSEA